jgi:hypothetical protein
MFRARSRFLTAAVAADEGNAMAIRNSAKLREGPTHKREPPAAKLHNRSEAVGSKKKESRLPVAVSRERGAGSHGAPAKAS